MVKLLLDEHISPGVAAGLRRRLPALQVRALIEWEGGSFLGQEDTACLRSAATRRWAMVTYDRRTIPPLLKSWTETGEHHGGVIFVEEKTIPPSDIGGLVRALAALAMETAALNWADRVCFLRR